MNKRIVLLIVALALAVTAVLFLLVGDREEARINRTLDKMVDVFGKGDQEGLVDSAGRSQFFAQQFIPQPDISIADFDVPLDTQNEIQSTVFQVRAAVQAISVKVFDRLLEMAPDRRAADMRFTARAQFTADGTTETVAQEFHLQWVKTDAGWQIAVAESKDALDNE